MRARFLSRFEWQGKDVYCYDDIDTGEVVYLEGGRGGAELRRFAPMDYPPARGRAIDVPPRQDVFDFVLKSYSVKKPYKDNTAHTHWAS